MKVETIKCTKKQTQQLENQGLSGINVAKVRVTKSLRAKPSEI